MIGETVPLNRRIFNASATLLMNAIIWIVIPAMLSSSLSGSLSGPGIALPLANPTYVVAAGAAITALFVIGALTDGSVISVPFVSGGNLAAALYIWFAVDGGTLSLSASGFSITMLFRTLLFLLILPTLFNAVRAPVEFLLERSEAAREAKDIP